MLLDATMLAVVGVGIVFAFLLTLVALLYVIGKVALVADRMSTKQDDDLEEVAAAIAIAYHNSHSTQG